MDIGQAIKQLREKHGRMPQSELAQKCGVSVNTVSSWETGKAYPPKSSIELLCQAFGISPAQFQLQIIEEEDFPEEKKVLYRAMLKPLRNELLEKQ